MGKTTLTPVAQQAFSRKLAECLPGVTTEKAANLGWGIQSAIHSARMLSPAARAAGRQVANAGQRASTAVNNAMVRATTPIVHHSPKSQIPGFLQSMRQNYNPGGAYHSWTHAPVGMSLTQPLMELGGTIAPGLVSKMPMGAPMAQSAGRLLKDVGGWVATDTAPVLMKTMGSQMRRFLPKKPPVPTP